jgi:Mrp family chromosome partitioning ATPase
MRELTVLLVAALGLALAIGEAYLLEYLDNTLKTAEDVTRLIPAPIVGHIFEQKNPKKKHILYQNVTLKHQFAEAFRILRTNIEFAELKQPLKTILVTSADSGDGKTSVATNLAMFVAQTNKKVLLVDADLRRPNIHE